MACVALTSLISTIELEFLQPTPRVSLHDQAPIKSFFTHLSSLQAFLQESSDSGVAAIKDLEFKIRDFALKAEDDIEIQLSNFLLAKDKEYQEKALQELHQTLQEAAEKAAVLLNTINNISSEDDDDDEGNETQPPIHWLKHASQSENGSSGRSLELVGRHGDRTRIINHLIWGSYLKIISIFGMSGIGKTTLAKSVFNDPKVENHFNVRSWITVSQEYNKTHILNLILRSISPAAENKIEEESAPDEELEEQVRGHLLYRKCLIVLDNIQDNRLWNDIRRCFPYSNSGSRILVTTRHYNLNLKDSFFYRYNYIQKMILLDPNESWDLFCNILSPKKRMSQFEKIRRHIVEICDGLPLSIVTVAERLSKCNDILKEWEKIKKEIESLGILDRSSLIFDYNQLSQDLKVCFLYLGVFPKRTKVLVKKLIGLWIAEGYLKPLEPNKKLKNQCYAYLQELIDRSLVLECNRSSKGEIKSCRMHSALHSFCVGESQREGIFCAVNTLQHSGLPLSEFSKSSRWLSLCKHSFDYYVLFSTNNPRSIFFFSSDDPKTFVPFKLLRVLAFVPPPFLQRVSMHLGDLVFLRYLSITQRFEGLGNIVSIIPNLHTLIVYSDEPQIGAPIHLPSKIWELPLLRHLELGDMYTADPPCDVKVKLQTLSWVSPTHCGMEVYHSFPDLRKLKIFYKDDIMASHTHGSSKNSLVLDNIDYLEQLERLTISVLAGWTVTLTEWFTFPSQLKKFRLRGTDDRSKIDLMAICKLPGISVFLGDKSVTIEQD